MMPQGGRMSVSNPSGPFNEATDNASGLMNPGLDPTDQDATAYGYPPMVGQGHNGPGGSY